VSGIELGVTCTLASGTCQPGDVVSKTVMLNRGTESVLLSLFAEDVQGTLNVKLYTLTETDQEVEVIAFPELTAPTVDLLLRRAAAVMQRVRIEVTCSGAGPSTFDIRAKGLTSGELSATIRGADDWNVQNTTVTSTPSLLIGADLTDRNGLMIRNANFTGTEILRLAESLTKLQSGVYASILPGESIQPDLRAGNVVYAESSGGTIRVEIVEIT